MDQELKERWVEALRSDKYKQGRGRLRNDQNQFCCLGVLCDVQGHPWIPVGGGYAIGTDGQTDNTGESNEKLVRDIGSHRIISELILMNDGCLREKPKSFKQIADFIEENL